MSSHETEVVKHLNACVLEGAQVFLPEYEIDRAVFPKVKRALEGIGGKWEKSAQAFVFKNDPCDYFSRIQQGEKLDLVRARRKATQFFETTLQVLEEIGGHIHISRDMRVLEPSAGKGAIAHFLRESFSKYEWTLDCCELDPENRSVLEEDGFHLVGIDFLQMQKPSMGYHLIVANPPFSGYQDIDHFFHMYSLLAPGGRIACVMSRSAVEGRSARSSELLEFLGYFFFTVIELPAGAFRESGTSVLDKPLDEAY